jgi:LacI family transcriptional regulator
MAPAGRTTIADIATATASAKSTVSCVLNGKLKQAGVSPERIKHIIETAKRLNYRPSAAARAMRLGRFSAIGLIGTDTIGLSSPFTNLHTGILAELHDAGMTLVRSQLPTIELATGQVRMLGEWGVDGLLIDYCRDVPVAFAELVASYHSPSVTINNLQPMDAVHPDDRGGFRLATRHLLDLGHRHIGVVSTRPGGHDRTGERLAGCREALGGEPLALLPEGTEGEESREARIAFFLRRPDRPTAILTEQLSEAITVERVARALGLSIPGDLSLVTTGDDPGTHGHWYASVILPSHEVGRESVRLLRRRIEAPLTALPTVVVPETFHPYRTLAPPR